MEHSASPLPLPLWPTLALSLTLFGLTATAVTVSARCTKQFYPSDSQAIQIAAPTRADLKHSSLRATS